MQENIHITDTTIDRIATMARGALSAQQVEKTYHLIVPPQHTHIDITKLIEAAQEHPNRKRGTATLCDLASFITYAQEQRAAASGYIYADPDKRTLTAVFNDHRDDDFAGFRDYRAVYTAELGREFALWLKNDRQPMEQEAFAVFLEENIEDVQDPPGDVLLAIALTLQAKTEVNFSSSRRLDNGQVQLAYTENVDARAGAGAIDIPREFSIGVRCFKNGTGFKLRARLKYRLGAGKVKFWYELDRPENAIETAFEEYTKQTAETSGYTVLIGKP